MLKIEELEKWVSWNVLECSSDGELSVLPRSGLNMCWKQGKVCARNPVKPICLMRV